MKEDIAVIGSGLMGCGIGQAFATAGHNVTLVDLDMGLLNQAISRVKSSLRNLSDIGLIDEPPEKICDRITLEPNLEKAVANVSFVEEAIFENLDLKKDMFRKLDSATRSDCILASNTTSLPVSSIAASTTHPERAIGAHFWNPPQLMPAVEVIRGEKTDDDTLQKTVAILRGIGKRPAVVQKDVPGQIGIRILYAMIREATWLVENQIATPEDIDSVVKEALGTRLEVVGPLELADLSGVDLVGNVAKGLYKTLDASVGPQKIVQEMVSKNEVGIKTGKGFYNWKDGSKNIEETVKLRDNHLIEILKNRKRFGTSKDSESVHETLL